MSQYTEQSLPLREIKQEDGMPVSVFEIKGDASGVFAEFIAYSGSFDYTVGYTKYHLCDNIYKRHIVRIVYPSKK